MAITPLPPAPQVTDDTATFNTKAFAWVDSIDDFTTEANALAISVNADASAAALSASQASDFADEAETASNASVGAANFKGEWSTLTGALAIPASVSHNGQIWVLTASLADVTAAEPSVDPVWLSASGSSAVSYPQNIQTADYTLVLDDAGKQIFHPASDANIRTFTIPSNASVAFSIGTTVLFVNENGGPNLKVAITSDTLVGTDGATGSRFIPPGEILTAIKVTATKWIGYLADASTLTGTFLAVGHDVTPLITAYSWSSAGFGTKFANPGTLPASTGYGVAFSPSGNAIAVAHDVTPFITAYPWSSSGFGTKFGNPGTLPASTGNAVAFSPAEDAIAVAHNNTPFITAYPWSSSGFGTKYTDPGTLPASTARGVAFSPAGTQIAVAHNNTPFITAYPWSSSGFGTKFADPTTLPTNTGFGVAFSPAGDAIAVAHFTTPFISAYPWSVSGFGTKFADPTTLPTGSGSSVAFGSL